MPAKDASHEAVKKALAKEGWEVEFDPLHLKWGRRDFYIDLAVAQFFLARKGRRRIAVEIKSFSGNSAMLALEQTLGQFLIYRSLLNRLEPKRKLYLAVSEDTFLDIFEDEIGRLVIEDYAIPLLIFDNEKEVIVAWKD